MGVSMTCCSSTEEKHNESDPKSKTNEYIPPVIVSYPALQENRLTNQPYCMPRSVSSTTILPNR